MIILLSLPALVIAIFIAGKLFLAVQFKKEVRQLFSLSKNSSAKNFQHSQLKDLPEPVKRYFKHILKEGQAYISYARMKHRGQFRTGEKKEWMNIKGEQYATTETPGFIWKGSTSLFSARDMYIANKGKLIVSIFSLFRVAKAERERYNQGELLRWLGESVLYPTNLLPNYRLKWLPIDQHSAKLIFNYQRLSLYFIVTFNDVGEITQMETKRYMDGARLETWIISATNYQEMNNILIPVNFEVTWRLPEGDVCYAKLNMTEIEYNKPAKF
ncbi:MAG: DUF6544 family protein [Sediminibacterium sp.]